MDRLIAENLRRAVVFGVPEEALTRLKRICAEMQTVYAKSGHFGLTRYMAENIPQAEGGALSVQCAVLYGAAGQLDAAFEHLDQAISLRDPALVHLAVAPHSGTAYAAIGVSMTGCGKCASIFREWNCRVNPVPPVCHFSELFLQQTRSFP